MTDARSAVQENDPGYEAISARPARRLQAEMSVSDNSAVLRPFEASPGFFGIGPTLNAGRRYLYLYGFLALLDTSRRTA
jgi:hypothetical protein